MRHKMLKNVTKSIILSDFPCLKHYFPCRDKPKWKDDKWNNNNKTTTTTTSFFINFYHSMLTTISVFFNKAWNYSNKRNANINIHHKVDPRAFFFAGRFINIIMRTDKRTDGWMGQRMDGSIILIDFNWPQLTVIDLNLLVLTVFDKTPDNKSLIDPPCGG